MLKFSKKDFLENQEATSKWCDDFQAVDWEELSNMLNKKVDDWLAKQPIVYGGKQLDGSDNWRFHQRPCDFPWDVTHKAILANIEPLPPPNIKDAD